MSHDLVLVVNVRYSALLADEVLDLGLGPRGSLFPILSVGQVRLNFPLLLVGHEGQVDLRLTLLSYL